MPTLTDEAILDLVKTTQRDLGRFKLSQCAQTLQDYEFSNRIMRKEQVTFETGTGLERTIILDLIAAARMTSMHGKDHYNIGDVMKKMVVPFRHVTSYYGWERREFLMNKGEKKIHDLMEVRRTNGFLSLIELMENAFVSAPASSDDELTAWGLDYWLVANSVEGFNGGAPSGFSDVAGIDHARFKNWTGTYTEFSKAVLIRAMRKMARMTDFKSPIGIKDYRYGKGKRYRVYVNEETIDQMEMLGEAQNENLGRDLFPMDGSITFNRNPIVRVPQFDTDTTNKIRFVNLDTFKTVFLQGDYFRESSPKEVSGQHNDIVVNIDGTFNFYCDYKRSNGILYKVAA